MIANHDRLDKVLDVLAYTDAPCGSLNRVKGQAEYCGFDCPTLRARMMNNENPATPLNQPHATRADPFDPKSVS